jgi:transposase, IS5 family
MEIFIYESARRIGDQKVLHKVDPLLDWSLFLPLLKSGLNQSGLGPEGYDEIVLFKKTPA